ncbi:MAG: GNAT family N-acetyltransferase [Steroidobacteraceae bacterium]|jgi:aminoglycoside 3-N-acetyltransferase I|nr:GNAT family N-acetyltransferase [Steroidobacteraceae bacterium]
MHEDSSGLTVRRLRTGDEHRAADLFAMMSAVFEEGEQAARLDPDYVRRLLAREDFLAVAAFEDGQVVGGVTGHVLPMTRSHSSELFIYDLAVRVDRQRRGVGRALVLAIRQLAAAEGIATSFVAADDEDGHALAFYRAIGGDGAPVTVFTWAD